MLGEPSKATLVVISRGQLLHWHPKWGLFNKARDISDDNDGCHWSPAEDGGGRTATATGNRLLLANTATSLEEPKTQPRLCQPG